MAVEDRPAPASAGATLSTSLDPLDWTSLRQQGHKMLDDMFDHLQSLRDQPVWQCAPAPTRAKFSAPLPVTGTPLEAVHGQFLTDILPYGSGNAHPGFMGWVQGGGTAVGMLAEMLAAGLNSNLGGRDHMPIVVERQIVAWMRDVFRFPATAQGLFLTGASQANFVAVLVARKRADKADGQVDGKADGLVGYASRAVHGCVPRAMEMAGVGAANLRLIDVNSAGQMDVAALKNAIERDERAGLKPFLLVGTAGTVDIGAIDDLPALADIATARGLHFHIDGALGALGVLSAELAPRLAGIELCDSLAFDFHKWAQVPYDAGFLLTRDGAAQKALFASEAAYLTRATRGMASGETWPCDYGPDLSRSFRALKTWFTLKTFGLTALGASMAANCRLAQSLAERIDAEPELERFAPVALNIVCFGYREPGTRATVHSDLAQRSGSGSGPSPGRSPNLNAQIVERLQEAGAVAPSVTVLNGRRVIRAAIVNHRTTQADIDTLVENVLALGREARSHVNTEASHA